MHTVFGVMIRPMKMHFSRGQATKRCLDLCCHRNQESLRLLKNVDKPGKKGLK